MRDSDMDLDWGAPLPEPWFPAEDMGHRPSDAYIQLTVRRTPKEFADFNVFLNAKFTDV